MDGALSEEMPVAHRGAVSPRALSPNLILIYLGSSTSPEAAALLSLQPLPTPTPPASFTCYQ